MITRIYNVTLVTPQGLVPDSAIDIQDTKILAVHTAAPQSGENMTLINGKGAYAMPGFVDIHIHGGANVDFMGATPQQVRTACAAHAKHGTTTILPTTVTAKLDMTENMIRAVRQAKEITTECTIAGVHLEGPFLSPKQAGAQDPEALIPPTEEVLTRLENAWPGGIRIMGVAPELPGGTQFGEVLSRHGIRATIAHSDANYATCVDALHHGYSDITHIYSGCSMVHRINGYRSGGVVEAGLLEDGFTVQVIADGKHLPPELLKLIVKCKGADKISVITDALFPAAADLPEGSVLTQANGMQTILEDGVMKMPDRQAFAGSIATMDRQMRNMVQLAGVSLCDAVTMATATPARVAGLDDRKGYLKPGFDADIVLMDADLQVQTVMAMGKII